MPSNSPPIVPSNSPPILAVPELAFGFDIPLSLALPVFDPDYDRLTFRLGPDAPAGVRLDPVAGVLEWAASEAQIGAHSFEVNVTDDANPPLSATQRVFITVLARNLAPTLLPIPGQTLVVGETSRISPVATDSNNDLVTFKLGTPSPTNAIIDPRHRSVFLDSHSRASRHALGHGLGF